MHKLHFSLVLGFGLQGGELRHKVFVLLSEHHVLLVETQELLAQLFCLDLLGEVLLTVVVTGGIVVYLSDWVLVLVLALVHGVCSEVGLMHLALEALNVSVGVLLLLVADGAVGDTVTEVDGFVHQGVLPHVLQTLFKDSFLVVPLHLLRLLGHFIVNRNTAKQLTSCGVTGIWF